MANKRSLKKEINLVCESLMAECVAVTLYGPEEKKESASDLFHSVMEMGDHFLSRVSYPEPGIAPKAYYKDLREKFNEQVKEILDQIYA